MKHETSILIAIVSIANLVKHETSKPQANIRLHALFTDSGSDFNLILLEQCLEMPYYPLLATFNQPNASRFHQSQVPIQECRHSSHTAKHCMCYLLVHDKSPSDERLCRICGKTRSTWTKTHAGCRASARYCTESASNCNWRLWASATFSCSCRCSSCRCVMGECKSYGPFPRMRIAALHA